MNLQDRLWAVQNAGHKVTGASALAPGLDQFRWRHKAVQEFNELYGAFVQQALDEKLAQVRALNPAREVLVEHYIHVCKDCFHLENGVFADIYALLRGEPVAETFQKGLYQEINTLSKFANGQQLAALQLGLFLNQQTDAFFTSYNDLTQHLDPVLRYELLHELEKAAQK